MKFLPPLFAAMLFANSFVAAKDTLNELEPLTATLDRLTPDLPKFLSVNSMVFALSERSGRIIVTLCAKEFVCPSAADVVTAAT